jgi:hypothetical protein
MAMHLGGRVKANTVRDICSVRKSEFKGTANIILAEINKQILEAAGNGRESLLVEIPRHYMGRDAYDWVDMGRTVVELLLEDGYYMSGTYVRFKLTWDRHVTKKPQASKPLITIPTFGRR